MNSIQEYWKSFTWWMEDRYTMYRRQAVILDTRHAVLLAVLSSFRWFRRLKGGHWEGWYYMRGDKRMWFQVKECFHITGMKVSAYMRGDPLCEHHWPKGPVTPPVEFKRTSGSCQCPCCNRHYFDHPAEPKVAEIHDGRAVHWLRRICTGERVKL